MSGAAPLMRHKSVKKMKLKSPEQMEAFVLQKALSAVILDGDVLKPVKKTNSEVVVGYSEKLKKELPK